MNQGFGAVWVLFLQRFGLPCPDFGEFRLHQELGFVPNLG